ncbi:MAG: hypothetical protein M3137_01550 [Actinomycetota bacterium]|nr:hypothetical protein [Actinomycetota bacterium]
MWARPWPAPPTSTATTCPPWSWLSGGGPCPLPIIEAFNDRGVSFQEGFGMTETAPAAASGMGSDGDPGALTDSAVPACGSTAQTPSAVVTNCTSIVPSVK